jgi:RNA-binding protein
VTTLSGPQLRKLKALAQRLEPVLRIGKAGLSDPFIQSADAALTEHELVKIKFFDFKQEKKTLAPILAERTSSAIIMRVGNVVVLYRQHPDPAQRRIAV